MNDAEVLALFEQLLDAPPDERTHLLDLLTAGRPDVRSRLEALFARDETDHPLLDADASHLDRALRDAPAPPPENEQIPGYRTVRELGRGGMGIVYLAERTNVDFRQQVALKIIAAHPDADVLAERLRRERRILAQLRHPNIAQLYDGGVTPSGQPFLVMEYIEGERIDEWCDTRRLDIHARIRLFLDVCAAVEHVQEQLVVHRDLKPANLLVTGDGVAKLLDFGIAKTVSPDNASTRTRLTGFTPGYASPEQLRNREPTPASDVYALGVILHELLTGARPFADVDDPFEAVRAVVETDPRPPSEAVSPDAQIAQNRSTTSDRLRRALRGDLDAIVLRAISRDPAARYGNVRELRKDLERFLALQPVLARRSTRMYRLRKFTRRHRTVLVTSVAAIALGAGASAIALNASDETGIVAYDHLLRGDIYLSARTPDDVMRGIEQYALAAAVAPESAEPLFREAYAWLLYADWGWQHATMDNDAMLARADSLIRRGLAVAPRSAYGLLALGYLRVLRDPDRHSGALEAFEQSLEADPASIEAWHQYGQALMVLDRYDDAARAYQRALALEPRRAMTLVPLGAMALYEREYDEALMWSDSAVSVAPANSYARASRARILLAAGDTAAARAEAELASGVDQGHAVPVQATLAAVYAAAGDHDRARDVYDAVPKPGPDALISTVEASSLAMAALAVGDTAAALDFVSRGRPRGAWFRFYLRAPQFDPLRSHPEFRAIAER